MGVFVSRSGDRTAIGDFLRPLSNTELASLRIGDEIDHQHGGNEQFWKAKVVGKKEHSLLIRYVDFDEDEDEWSDSRQEPWRYAKLGSVSQHRLRLLLDHQYDAFFAEDERAAGDRDAKLRRDLELALETIS